MVTMALNDDLDKEVMDSRQQQCVPRPLLEDDLCCLQSCLESDPDEDAEQDAIGDRRAPGFE